MHQGDSQMCFLYYGDKKNLLISSRGNHSIYVRGDAMIDSGEFSLLLKCVYICF